MILTSTVLGIPFSNPLISAAGKWAWTAERCTHIVDGGAGGITLKSFSTLIRKGHPEPIIIHTEHYTLNAVGLPSEGFEVVQKDLTPFLQDRPVPVIASIFGETVERFGEAVSVFSALPLDAIELNISCPNVQDDHGRPFSYAPQTAAAAVAAARKSAPSIPLFAKLSPNIPDIAAIALACAEAGCNGFTLVNTLGPGLAIDIDSRSPILSNKTGGMSGPALKPIAVRCVADVYKATEGKLPIIGTGGVQSGADALELMMAGASLVGIGTAVLTQGYDIFRTVADEMTAWCEKQGVKNVEEIIGSMKR